MVSQQVDCLLHALNYPFPFSYNNNDKKFIFLKPQNIMLAQYLFDNRYVQMETAEKQCRLWTVVDEQSITDVPKSLTPHLSKMLKGIPQRI